MQNLSCMSWHNLNLIGDVKTCKPITWYVIMLGEFLGKINKNLQYFYKLWSRIIHTYNASCDKGNLTIIASEQKGLKPKSPITISSYKQNINLQIF
jgi:hypothetical protein